MSTRDILPDEAITWLPVQPDRRPFLCPVCAGRGWVDGGFYGGYTQSTNARTTQACQSCGGSGIVWGSNDHDKTICLDFDGVLHGYSRGWQGGLVYDDPVPGAVYACQELARRFHLIVCTARDNLHDVRMWLAFWEFPDMQVVREKPPAILYVDDRGLRFAEWPEALAWIAKFLSTTG